LQIYGADEGVVAAESRRAVWPGVPGHLSQGSEGLCHEAEDLKAGQGWLSDSQSLNSILLGLWGGIGDWVVNS
jgi:hypothetical protein